MLKVQLSLYTRLLLVGLLASLLALYIVSTAVQFQGANNSIHPTLPFQTENPGVGPKDLIACNGGSEGSCGGY